MLNWRSKNISSPAFSKGLLPPGVGGELVSVTRRKPASLSIFRPSAASLCAGMVIIPFFSASTSSSLICTPWIEPTIRKRPWPRSQ
jgi:hypothetical protein